jgi:hypothetical protein
MTVNGPRALAILASEFRALGYRDLKLQLARGTRNAGKPFIEQARANARDRLPKGGGLNNLVADERIAVRNRLTGRSVGISVRTNWRLVNQTNAGFVRHPTFGRREKGQWSTDQIPAAAGWWDDAVKSAGPQMQAEVYAVMRETAELILARVRGL